jgi:hypothetical protein
VYVEQTRIAEQRTREGGEFRMLPFTFCHFCRAWINAGCLGDVSTSDHIMALRSVVVNTCGPNVLLLTHFENLKEPLHIYEHIREDSS